MHSSNSARGHSLGSVRTRISAICSRRHAAWPGAVTLCLLLNSAGCQQLVDEQQARAIATLREDLSTLTGAVVSTQASVAEHDERSVEHTETLNADLVGLNKRLERLPQQLEALCRPAPAEDSPQCPDQPTVLNASEQLVVGELEEVWLDPPGARLTARMDTGADSSSVNAQNLTEFERDGEDWVRFEWVIEDEVHTVERPIQRFVRVVQQADPEGTRRPVISLRLRIGGTDDVFDFTLADRSHLDHQMILGRNFLTNLAVVDVGKRFVQPRLSFDLP